MKFSFAQAKDLEALILESKSAENKVNFLSVFFRDF